jgi:flavorubredoxin
MRRRTAETREETIVETYQATSEIDVITSNIPIPGFGLVPVNAFVIKGTEPILVDTHAVVETEDFMSTLGSVIDPADLRWIWLTHTDFDHIGSLGRLLEVNPSIRVITTFLGVGIMSLSAPLPMDRLHLLNPGEKLTVGDRTLAAFKPPVFDNPSTTGFVDESSGTMFSSDCFGALLQDVPLNAADLTDDQLHEGQVFWTRIDSPWVHKVDEAVFGKELDGIRAMKPDMILSSHLPAASADLTDKLLASLAAVPTAAPFVGPDQPALEHMLQQMAAG